MTIYDEIEDDVISLDERATVLLDLVEYALNHPNQMPDNIRFNSSPNEKIPSLTWQEAYSFNLDKMREIKRLIRSLKGW